MSRLGTLDKLLSGLEQHLIKFRGRELGCGDTVGCFQEKFGKNQNASSHISSYLDFILAVSYHSQSCIALVIERVS